MIKHRPDSIKELNEELDVLSRRVSSFSSGFS